MTRHTENEMQADVGSPLAVTAASLFKITSNTDMNEKHSMK